MAPFEAPLVIQVSHKRITRVVTAYDTNSFFYAGVIESSKLRKVTIDGKGRFHFTVKTSLIDDPNIFWNDERYPDPTLELSRP